MKDSKKRNSNNTEVRGKEMTKQPGAAREAATGFGDKKLDGPNRPST